MHGKSFIRALAIVLLTSSLIRPAGIAWAQDPDPQEVKTFGRTPAVSGGHIGQRQTRLDTVRVAVPAARIANRINNRIDNRVHTRIDRGYKGLGEVNAAYEDATEQTRVEGRKSSR